MENPGRLPLNGDRYTPFVRTLALFEVDLSGATFAMQVRDRKDGGTVRADLATVTTVAEGVRIINSGTDSIAGHIAAGFITLEQAEDAGYTTTDTVALTLLGIRINESTMEAMPFGTEVGDDWVGYWDMHITPSGGTKEVWLYGTFTVRAGATQ